MSTIQDNYSNNTSGGHHDRSSPHMIPNSVLFNRKSSSNFAHKCPLEGQNIDYKNISLLTQYITPAGRIIPSMISSISQPNQRKLRQAIKRARMLALLPFSSRN